MEHYVDKPEDLSSIDIKFVIKHLKKISEPLLASANAMSPVLESSSLIKLPIN